MMSALIPRPQLVDALRSPEGDGLLLIPDPTPLHCLWLAKHLHLLLEHGLRVVILQPVREMFASHQDCRKGVEILGFLDQNTPPFKVLNPHPGAMEGILSGSEKTFILTGDDERWTPLSSLAHVEVISTIDFISAAGRAGLIADPATLMQAIHMPGEITGWA